jgi:TFIIF-interacting CTD phosphatase-like protein
LKEEAAINLEKERLSKISQKEKSSLVLERDQYLKREKEVLSE